MEHRFVRLTKAATSHHQQKQFGRMCEVDGCSRPCVVYQKLAGGMVRMRPWCCIHRRAKNRPLKHQPLDVKATPIPAHIKTAVCAVEECGGICEVERAGRVIDGVLTGGWLVRSFCRRHRRPTQRPVGWMPGDGDAALTRAIWQRRMKKFLGVKKWQDRGWYGSDHAYRLRSGRMLHIVEAEAMTALREQLTLAWNTRETLGAFAARYNLAIVAVVGATLAIEEREG